MEPARGEYQSAAEAFRKIASLEAKVRGLTDELERNLRTARELQALVNINIGHGNSLASTTEQCWRDVADQIHFWTERRSKKVQQIDQQIEDISKKCAEEIKEFQNTLKDCTSSEDQLKQEMADCTATNRSHFDAKTECTKELEMMLGHIKTCETDKAKEEKAMDDSEGNLKVCRDDHLVTCNTEKTESDKNYEGKQNEDVEQTGTAEQTYSILEATKDSLDDFLKGPEQ